MTVPRLGSFKALVLDQLNGRPHLSIRSLAFADLEPAEVRVAVEYSSVNYKDALILAERGYRAARYPMVPGIDLAGTVLESAVSTFTTGERVVLNGAGLGETRWGGFAEFASVDAASLVRVPSRFSTRDAMAIGTAGLAAALAVLVLEEHGVVPGSGPVLVTGATGGVGSLAVALLAARGHTVTASAGKSAAAAEWLARLGAADVVGRLPAPEPGRPLLTERWAGVVDAVGGAALARALAEVRYGGAVASTGFAAGLEVPLHLAPLLVRGVALLGVNTSSCPVDRRRAAWELLAASLPDRALSEAVTMVALEDVPRVAERMLAGDARGRTVVDLTDRFSLP